MPGMVTSRIDSVRTESRSAQASAKAQGPQAQVRARSCGRCRQAAQAACGQVRSLGRVASPGSVRVDALLEVERYSHVMHLVSRLSAELRDGLDRFDALAACFPAGTVTGAPKIRAMQILDELEPQPRGVYGGAVLYADHAGVLDACIAIRTLVARDGRAVLQAGAGLVADSVPEREFEETQAKAGALLRAIRLAEGWAAPGPPGGAA